ncbi:MAG: cytochrome c3 family protein [Bacteroidota bacterium]
MGKISGNIKPTTKRYFTALAFLLFGFGIVLANNPSNEKNDEAVEQIAATASAIGLGQAPGQPAPAVQVEYESIFLTLAVMVGVLLLVVLLLIFISANLLSLIRVREGKDPLSLAATLKKTKEYALNPYIATLGNFVVIIIAMIFVVPIARGVGLSQGYQPEQPIWFSHKIHAGQYEVDCQYCHTGVAKGKNAWVPSVNVCMNCHKAIKQGSITGEKEISKIYYAYENNVPINWVRIHNLPDLAYFNHQQHVVAGKQECETCHGPIAEMDEVYQYAPLSMGWCINCHRETEVDAELYKKLGREDVHTVEDIGGLACARCHY